MNSLKYRYMILAMVFFGSNCSSQDNNSSSAIDRKPAVAGQFYAGNPDQLRSDLAVLFKNAAPRQCSDAMAIISPHAGYVFSGEVAASSFNQIDPGKKYQDIFIIASSHRMTFDGASIYDRGDYETPLGKVKVNRELAGRIVKENKVFNDQAEPHLHEHSLEVQLPFLQYKLGNNFRIIPIIVGTQSASTCRKIGEALKPYFNDNNLFVISTDFSHYPDYDDASLVDHETAEAIARNSPDALLSVLKDHERRGISNLATSLCGWTSVLSLLYMTEDRTDVSYRLIKYMNSGDTRYYGDKDRVVGYFSIAVDKQPPSGAGFSLSENEKEDLLLLARNTIEEYVTSRKIPDVNEDDLTEKEKTPFGAFVTLHEQGNLRGCIGRFDATDPLYKVVQEMSVAAATRDSRFPPVTPEEIDDLDIEISVLTPLKKISSIDEIQLGRDGIYIKKGYNSGTFLPQVATETGWSKEEFLGHCARDKARIGWDGWKEAEIYTYQAYIFSEKEMK